MYAHEFKKRVRYGETDQMGYVYYGHYAQYYEIGRAELIRSLGISYKEIETIHRIMLPVLEVKSRFKAPGLYDELLTIRTILIELPTKMITFHAEIRNEQNKLIHKAEVKLFFIDMDTNKRISAPEFLLEKLSPHF